MAKLSRRVLVTDLQLQPKQPDVRKQSHR
uniref:Uncharacterized protein n=1 Tax=Arundo donax TaxID=35708 RepID=A0A0A9A4V5_ARUDO